MTELTPPSASSSPRFCNIGNFMRLQSAKSSAGLDFAIIGIPFDTGSSFRTGSRFGPNGIRRISAMIKPNNGLLGVNVFEQICGADLGDVPVIPGYIKETYKEIEKSITDILNNNAVPIALGGDHSITLGELRAVAKKYGKVSLIHFDSHFDLCESVFGQPYNHGTPFRRAIEEGLIDPNHSIQIGMRGSSYYPDEFEMSEKLGFTVISGNRLHKMDAGELKKLIKDKVGDNRAFCSFDIDFVDPAYAPGTGTPEVGGFTSFETLEYFRTIRDMNIIGMDVVEVAPEYDCSEITAYLAANLVYEYLSMLALKKKHK
jgi:agmatinase